MNFDAWLLRHPMTAGSSMRQRPIGMNGVPAKHSHAEFLRAEIHTGLTRSKIALEATYQDKMERNRANARKAYDAVLRFIPQSVLEANEAEEIKRGLAQLESQLRQLGEEL